jgi:hypothetical protein
VVIVMAGLQRAGQVATAAADEGIIGQRSNTSRVMQRARRTAHSSFCSSQGCLNEADDRDFI